MPSREDILANITTGPGRPSRGDILAGMTTGAPGPLLDLVRRPKDQPQRTPGLTTEQMFPRPETVQLPQLPEPEPGPFEFAGPLGKFIDLIDTPRAAIVSTIKEVGDLFMGEGFSPVDWWKQTEDNMFMQEVMRDWGLDLPGPLNTIIGLGFDIAFDPITYATGGIGAAGRAGMTIPRLVKSLSKGKAFYDDILKHGASKSGVTLAQAGHKSGMLEEAVLAVGKSGTMHAAGREALQEVGLLGRMGLFVPTTGRLGRGLRLDKVLDAVTRGGVTTRRAKQAARLPYIDDLARPVAGKTLDDAAEAVARFGRAGLDDAAAAEAKIVQKMKDIAKGVDLGDIPDDFYTAAARMAARMPVEAVTFPGVTGNVLTKVVPHFGKLKGYGLGSRPAEMIEEAFNTKASIKRGMRSGNYETILAANRAMTSNSAGWAARNRFMDLMSKDALALRRRARKLGLPKEVVDDMWRTELYEKAPGVRGIVVDDAGLPVMNPAFREKFGAHMGRVGEGPITDFWTQGRKWMDDALERANMFGGMDFMARSADELWVMRLPLRSGKMYTPMAAREMVAGAEFLDVRLLDQVDDPLRRTVEEQMRAIAQAKHGDKAEEIFDPNIWHAMDRYLSKVGEGVRRSKVMTLLEEQGVVFKEPLTWVKGQIDKEYKALKGLYGNRGDAFDEMFRQIEAGADVEKVKAVRMKLAASEGASAGGEQFASMAAEAEIIEARLVELQVRLLEKMTTVTRKGREASEALAEFMEPLLQEAALLGYRHSQLKAIGAALEMPGIEKTVTDAKQLQMLKDRFGAVEEALRALIQDAKSLADVDTSVKAMREMLRALQTPLKQLEKQGLLDSANPEMRDWLRSEFDIREILKKDPGALTPGGLGLPYLDYNSISLDHLPRWFSEVQDSWQKVSGAYQGAFERLRLGGAMMDPVAQRQALTGGILFEKGSPFVRLEAVMQDGLWQPGVVRGGAMVSEGEPLKWSAAPLEAPSLTAQTTLRRPKYSIPSEEELELAHAPSKITYASSKDELARKVDQLAGKAPSQEDLTLEAIQAATGMSLEERQALRQREWREFTATGKHVGPKPRRSAWRGETAMSAREVDGRRQIDTWTLEPYGTGPGEGWSISVNGEEVASASSLKDAKVVAQAEATKRGGLAPSVREVAAEAVTPPPAAAPAYRDPFADTYDYRPRTSLEEGEALLDQSPARPTDPQPGLTEADALELQAIWYDMRGTHFNRKEGNRLGWYTDSGGSYVSDMRPVVERPVYGRGKEPRRISLRIRKEDGIWTVYVLETPMEFQEFDEGVQALARRLKGTYAHQAFEPTVQWGPNRPAPWEQLFPGIGDAAEGAGFRTL